MLSKFFSETQLNRKVLSTSDARPLLGIVCRLVSVYYTDMVLTNSKVEISSIYKYTHICTHILYIYILYVHFYPCIYLYLQINVYALYVGICTYYYICI